MRAARWNRDCLPTSLSVTASTAMRPPGRRPTTAPKIDDCHLRHSKIAIPVNGHFGFVVRCRRHAQGAPGRQGEQVHLHAQLLTAIVIRYLLANPGTGSDSRGQREIYGFENFHFRLFPFADPSWREQSFSRNGLPSRNGGVEVCFSTRGRAGARVLLPWSAFRRFLLLRSPTSCTVSYSRDKLRSILDKMRVEWVKIPFATRFY